MSTPDGSILYLYMDGKRENSFARNASTLSLVATMNAVIDLLRLGWLLRVPFDGSVAEVVREGFAASAVPEDAVRTLVQSGRLRRLVFDEWRACSVLDGLTANFWTLAANE